MSGSRRRFTFGRPSSTVIFGRSQKWLKRFGTSWRGVVASQGRRSVAKRTDGLCRVHPEAVRLAIDLKIYSWSPLRCCLGDLCGLAGSRFLKSPDRGVSCFGLTSETLLFVSSPDRNQGCDRLWILKLARNFHDLPGQSFPHGLPPPGLICRSSPAVPPPDHRVDPGFIRRCLERRFRRLCRSSTAGNFLGAAA